MPLLDDEFQMMGHVLDRPVHHLAYGLVAAIADDPDPLQPRAATVSGCGRSAGVRSEERHFLLDVTGLIREGGHQQVGLDAFEKLDDPPTGLASGGGRCWRPYRRGDRRPPARSTCPESAARALAGSSATAARRFADPGEVATGPR